MILTSYHKPLSTKNAVSVLIINSNEEVLGVSRKNNHSLFGLPGGKVDGNEDLKSACIREIEEECGLIIDQDDLIKFYSEWCISDKDPNDKYFVTTFLCKLKDQIPSNQPNEGVVAWVSWEKLIDGPFKEYNQSLKNFYYKLVSENSNHDI